MNDAGDERHPYGPMQHAEWNGWTPADVVFPSFVGIVEAAMTLSLGQKIAAGASRMSLVGQAARRALTLCVPGPIVCAYF